jgi:uncharacterized protein (DUF2147 family)
VTQFHQKEIPVKPTLLMMAIVTITPIPSLAQAPHPLAGIWRQDDGSATVRIQNCSNRETICGTVIAERLEPQQPSLLNQTVVRDMRPAGKQAWVGNYVVEGQSMKARAKLLGPDALAVKVCSMGIFCETIRLNRVR